MEKTIKIIGRLKDELYKKQEDTDEEGEYNDSALELGTYAEGYQQALIDVEKKLLGIK